MSSIWQEGEFSTRATWNRTGKESQVEKTKKLFTFWMMCGWNVLIESMKIAVSQYSSLAMDVEMFRLILELLQ